MIKVDRSELDTAIEGLGGIFSNTAKVLADFEVEKTGLEKRGNDLSKRLDDLQQLKVEILLKREEEKDTATYIKLSKQLTEADDEVQILESLQEEQKEDLKQLKQRYIQPITEAYSKESAVKREFDVNYTVDLIRYELVKGIADYADAVRAEDVKVIGTIRDHFLDDSILMQDNRGFQRNFDYERNKLSYSSPMPNLLTRNNINLATSGGIDNEIRKPKPKEVK